MMIWQLCVLCALWSRVIAVSPELKLVHVIFSHKSYAPFSDLSSNNDFDLPRNLSYEYFQESATDMPNEGKLNMYNLGLHLRKAYAEFLGTKFTSEIMKMRTSETALSMISGQLVNAGLWLPNENQKWNDEIDWQPTPADYVAREKDTLLLGTNCPNFRTEMRKVLNSEEVRNTLLSYSPLFETISQHTGLKIQTPSDVALLYSSLETKADINQSLPEWAFDYFPHGAMYNLTLLEYDLLTSTPLQRKLTGGTMLKEIISNCLLHAHGSLPQERKMMLYSGDERNLVGILKSLDLWQPHIPSEAASVIIELYYENSTDSHGIKVKYYTGIDGDTITLKIENCTEICPMKSVLNMVFHVLPESEDILCNWKALNTTCEQISFDSLAESHADICKSRNLIIILLIITVSLTNQIM